MRWEKVSQCRTVLATSNAITCLWHCGMRHRGGRTVIQARLVERGKQKSECQGKCRKWRTRQKCTEVRFCGGLPRSSVEVSVMDMERRGWHTQATVIIQLLNKEEYDERSKTICDRSDLKVMSMHKELSVKSRVRGDFHARFCERVRVKLPRSTRPCTALRILMDSLGNTLQSQLHFRTSVISK